MDKTTKFLLTIPTELKQRLQEQADEKGLTLTAYMRMILIEQVQYKLKTKNARKVIIDEGNSKYMAMDKDRLSEIKDLVNRSQSNRL